MIYDFVEIAYHLSGKVRPNFGLFEPTGFNYPKGHLFKARAFTDLDLYLNERTHWLTIRGSLSFYFQGHNFRCDAKDLKAGIEFLSSVVGANLFGGYVEKFEVGALIETSHKPQQIFTTHTGIKGMKPKPYEFGKWFEDKVLRVKLYDAGKRMKQTIDKGIRNQLQADCGYQPNANYVRIENHHKKPEIRFKQPVRVVDLVSERFQETVKLDLLQTYQSIVKTPALILPEHLDKPSTSDLYLMALQEVAMQHGLNVEERINNLLRNCQNLTKEDVKARRRKIKADLGRVTTGQCDYDLEEQLRQKLG